MIDPIINTNEYNSFSTELASSTESTMWVLPLCGAGYQAIKIKIIY